MHVARVGWVFLAFWTLPPGLTAQKWFDEFRPDPRCFRVVSLSSPQPGGSDAAGGLVVQGVWATTKAPVQSTWVVIERVVDSAGIVSLADSRVTDSSGRHRFLSLPAGPVVVKVRWLGVAPRQETLLVRAHAIDTVVIPLRGDISDDGIRCAPPGFRRTGETACVTDPNEVQPMLDFARHLADPSEHYEPKLARFWHGRVSLVHDESTCDRAGRAYGRGTGPPRRVVVVRVGDAGYVVYDPFEPHRGGEFTTTMVFDRRWRLLAAYDD
jgi:hypothetical protein